MFEPDRAIVVLEKTPRWVPELRRCFAAQQWPVRGCRSVSDVLERTATERASGRACLAVVDLSFGLTDSLAVVAELGRRQVPTVVIGTLEMRMLEASLLELGAAVMFLLPLTATRLATDCQRLLEFDRSAAASLSK